MFLNKRKEVERDDPQNNDTWLFYYQLVIVNIVVQQL